MFKIKEIRCYLCNELIEEEIFSIFTLPKNSKSVCTACKEKLTITKTKDTIATDNKILIVNRDTSLKEFAIINENNPEEYYFLRYVYGNYRIEKGLIKNLHKYTIVDDTYIENYIKVPSHRNYLELKKYLSLLKELINRVPIPPFILP